MGNLMGNLGGLAAVFCLLLVVFVFWVGEWFVKNTFYLLEDHWGLILACVVVFFIGKKFFG